MLSSDLDALDALASNWEGISHNDVLAKMRTPCMIYAGERDDAYPKALKASTGYP